jgi:hypothetical protein
MQTVHIQQEFKHSLILYILKEIVVLNQSQRDIVTVKIHFIETAVVENQVMQKLCFII